MKRNILSIFITLCLFLFGGESFLSAQEKVTVAAAANLSAVAPALGQSFEKEFPGENVVFTFGSSGALVTQIVNGAPFDVFLSADMGFGKKLADAGMAASAVRPYAVGKLVLLSARSIDLSSGLKVVADKRVRQIANCNPELAPYGRAAQQALTKVGLWDVALPKLLVAQNISQSLQFTLAGADVGFVNLSALYAPELAKYKEGRDWVLVDQNLYQPIEQGFVVVKGSESKKVVRDFSEFLVSDAAQKVFASFGYGTP